MDAQAGGCGGAGSPGGFYVGGARPALGCGSPGAVGERGEGGRGWAVRLGGGAGLSVGDIVRHVVVYGVVGSGKTTLAKRILYEASLRLDAGFLVIDWEGEYVGLARALEARVYGGSGEPIRLSLFEAPAGVDAEVYAGWVSSMLAGLMAEEGWAVTPQMEAVLRDAVRAAVREGAGVGELAAFVREAARGRRWGGATADALEARLSRLLHGPLRRVLDGGAPGPALEGRSVIDLSWVSGYSRPDARLLARLLLARAYFWAARRGGRGPPFIVVVEEAEEVAPSPARAPARQLSELVYGMMHLRKRMVGLVVVAHSPGLLDPGVARLAGTVASFRLADPEDARAAAARLGVDPRVLLDLRVGEAVLKRAEGSGYVHVRVEPPPILDDAALKLLDSIRREPYLTIRERRSILGMRGSTFSRALKALLEAGLVRKVTVNTGRGRPVVLLETPGANPGAAHHFLVHRARLEARALIPGAKVAEAGDADLAIETPCTARIAVEAETGSNIDAGKYSKLKNNYDYLIIICTNKPCTKRAGRAAVDAGWAGAFHAITLSQLPDTLTTAAREACTKTKGRTPPTPGAPREHARHYLYFSHHITWLYTHAIREIKHRTQTTITLHWPHATITRHPLPPQKTEKKNKPHHTTLLP